MPRTGRFSALAAVVFLAASVASLHAGTAVRVQVDPNAIILTHSDHPILAYYTATYDVPAGVDPVFCRSGFVHPLWSPSGRVLTRIQPPDHYHHYGIWNPWTKVLVEGREVDFWNLAKRQGTVRFAGLVGRHCNADAAGFTVRQEHVEFRLDAPERVVLGEELEIKACARDLDGRSVWIVDWTSHLTNLLDTPVELSAYRYGGGIGFRATAEWQADNTSVHTSAGKSRDEADGTRARWCDVRGWTDADPAGILFLSHPENRQHPEPMRVWPSGMGDFFFEFCPIRHEAWTLEPAREYTLRYRLLVYDGELAPDTAETLWQEYAQPAEKPAEGDHK